MTLSFEERAQRAWEDLSISDNFIFLRVMQNRDLCKRLIERILHIRIRELAYPHMEKTIDLRLDSKSVRLDVYVEDEQGTVYNIEMQTTKGRDGELTKRTRYYQAMIDMDLLGKNFYYDHLRQTYIIFVCTFDLFGLEQRIYTFRNMCAELPDLALGDGATKIFLNAKGLRGAVDEDIEHFLKYVNGVRTGGTFIEELEKEVERVKYQKETRRSFMTLYMEYQRHRLDGLEEGRRAGMEQGRREGMEKGRREGMEKGRREGVLDMARSLLTLNVPLDVIEKSSGMTRAEILALQQTSAE